MNYRFTDTALMTALASLTKDHHPNAVIEVENRLLIRILHDLYDARRENQQLKNL